MTGNIINWLPIVLKRYFDLFTIFTVQKKVIVYGVVILVDCWHS